MKHHINILDKGYVRLIEASGTDLDPVNCARVSYNKQKEQFSPADSRLLNFLGREDHTSPFRHSFMRFEVYAPLMVARQWMKYLVGSDHAEQPTRDNDPFFGWNESSRRYVTEDVEFYLPDGTQWRSAPANSKQGSGAPIITAKGEKLSEALNDYQAQGLRLYEEAISAGACTEQARLFLPAYGLYVRWRWAASLQGVCHFLYQRLEHSAQKEIQDYAHAVDKIARIYFPNSVSAYVDQKQQQQVMTAMLQEAKITPERLQQLLAAHSSAENNG